MTNDQIIADKAARMEDALRQLYNETPECDATRGAIDEYLQNADDASKALFFDICKKEFSK